MKDTENFANMLLQVAAQLKKYVIRAYSPTCYPVPIKNRRVRSYRNPG